MGKHQPQDLLGQSPTHQPVALMPGQSIPAYAPAGQHHPGHPGLTILPTSKMTLAPGHLVWGLARKISIVFMIVKSVVSLSENYFIKISMERINN